MTSFISDQDFTTPAHTRVAADVEERTARRESSPAPFLAVVFLAAVWLVVSAVPIGYIGAGRYDVFWGDTVVGIAVAIVTMVRLLRPTPALAWVTAGLGGWLLVAPLVLQYGWSAPTANDLAVGLVMLIFTGLSAPS
ncbi:hypothetical protein ACFO1B_25625 [Dactylosporangium siamense]|uniref:SPW repeat-containing integral membrane domain-containing protein n=1 Tax=Dactylosporangium siamense TaxID=685454 RepID=A0A919U986_9ACTN|nr:hypothetical protein [Dactylosporangium siamense]GIG47319.1 hypothetical protein Dsi01nite_053600 [Dactylosporangium siamense]